MVGGRGFCVTFCTFSDLIEFFREMAALVDQSWRMEMGGVLREEPLPV